MDEKREILEKLYEDFLEEKESVQKDIDNCENKLSEINSYIDSIKNMEDSDFKVFSPRDVESIYKDSLEKNRNLKNKFESDYQDRKKKKKDIDKRLKKIEFLLQNSSENVKTFEIQEKERQRIARDLHDSALQNLTHLVHKIELASLYIEKDPVRTKLELTSLSKNVKDIIEEIRNTIFDLRPMQFDDLGLKESVLQLVEKIKKENDIQIKCNIDDNISLENKEVLMSIYRIIQESVNNAVKHSNGSFIEISVKNEDDCFDIHISDNGEGFHVDEIFNEKAKHHFGLMILEERVNILHGTITIDSEIEKGTKVHVQLPLKYLCDGE